MIEQIEAIERLAKLLDDGKVSREEYEVLKSQVVGASPSGVQTETAPIKVVESPPASVDRYAMALEGSVQIEGSGWYPDPERLGTHMRFYAGDKWTDHVRERILPGWYSHPEHGVAHEEYWDGLRFTDLARKSPLSSSTSRESRNNVTGISTLAVWKLWVGSFLILLGGLGLLATASRYSQEPAPHLGIILFDLAINPLIWGGIIGVTMLVRGKRRIHTE